MKSQDVFSNLAKQRRPHRDFLLISTRTARATVIIAKAIRQHPKNSPPKRTGLNL